MTLEELIAKLDKLEATTSERIDTLEAAAADKDAEIERLKKHSARLLSEKKKGKAKAPEPEPDDDDADDSDDALPRVHADYAARIAALEAKLQGTEKKAADALIAAALKDGVASAKIAPQFAKAFEALIRTGRKVEAKEGAVTIDGKAAAEAIAEFAASDEGRHYVAAPASGASAAHPATRTPAPALASGSQRTKSELKKQPGGMGKFIREHGDKAWSALPA